ncbi:hypothetical protein MNV49_005366 [Pseudohyphozyma bogoriensis]|nr:hypothetical protein MNV49_005366 [Pseudohyphozyma bogoriensis]
MRASTLALLSLGAFSSALRQPYDYYKALQDFQTGFLNPASIVDSGVDSPAFAEDIIGRVDVTTTFEGIQLNTEYIYALWLAVTNDNTTTSLLGSIQNQTVQTLVIEPPVVFVSTITNLYYPTVDFLLPVQIDLILRFDDDLKITSYDATFRRWSEAWYYLLPKIVPQIAIELNTTYNATTSNSTALVAERAAIDVCSVAMEYCVGNNTQYTSHDECMTFLTEDVPFGNPWEGGLNTGWCRYIHKNMVPKRPDVHCAHVGPSGGDMCIHRDYIDITTTFPFASTLVAPNATIDPAEVDGLSADSFDGLAKAELRLVYYTTVAFCIKCTAVIVSVLYVFEMTYRSRMRMSLLLHHFFTLFAIFALFISLENTNHPATIPTGSIWLWQATSEQAIFVGMFMFRLNYPAALTARVLRVAAVQSFVFKFAFAIYLVAFWGQHLARYHSVGTDVFFSVTVCLVGSLLMATQVHGSLAVWRIAAYVEKTRALASQDASKDLPVATPSTESLQGTYQEPLYLSYTR